MTNSISKISVFICCFCTLLAQVWGDVKDNATGDVFPSEVTFDQGGKSYSLQATGVATRKKFFVTVYSVAHYLQQGSTGGDKFQQIMQDNVAKQLTMRWARSIPAVKVQDGFMESFKKTLTPTDLGKLQNEISQFIGFFNHDVNKGDESVLRWLPGGYVEVDFDGKQVGTISNPEFAKALWSIWFSQKGAVDRNNLTSLMR